MDILQTTTIEVKFPVQSKALSSNSIQIAFREPDFKNLTHKNLQIRRLSGGCRQLRLLNGIYDCEDPVKELFDRKRLEDKGI